MIRILEILLNELIGIVVRRFGLLEFFIFLIVMFEFFNKFDL